MFLKLPLSFLALVLITTFNASAQCSVSIVNFPHGNCEGTDIELIALPSGGTNGYTFEWTGPDGFSSNDQYVYISQASIDETGLYQVTVTSLSDGSTAQNGEQVTKQPSPVVYTGGQQGGCIGETTQIYAQDFAGNYGPYTYQWEYGQTTQYIDVAHNGSSYPAPACTVTNAFGCSSMNNSTFMIYTYNSPQQPVIEAASATTFCKGGSVDLIAPANPDVTYQWKKGMMLLANETSNSITVAIAGNYKIIATNVFNCSAISNNINVTVNQKPAAAISVNGNTNLCSGNTVNLTANSGTNYTYEWRRNGNNYNSLNQQDIVIDEKGNYRVIVTNQFGCSKTSLPVAVTENCREAFNGENSEAYSLSIYPNPSQHYFTVDLTDITGEEAVISITDMTGRTVERIIPSQMNVVVGKDLPAGTYLLNVETASVHYSKLIVKTN